MFATSPLFMFLNESKARITVLQGGTSSGKTYSTIQWLYYKAIQEPGSVITVVGQDIPNLKKGALRDAETIYNCSESLRTFIRFWNRSDRTILFNNGSLIEFTSYDSEQDAKSGKRDYLFINEANGIPYLMYWQLNIRTRKKTILDYNPTAQFWAHESVIGQPGVELNISDHRHNPFLSDEQHKEIEGIKDVELWKVYARGLTGNVQGLIFPNWQMIDDSLWPKQEPCFYGLDFGYTNDPTAAVKLCRVANNLYVHELCYTPGIAPIQLKQMFLSNGYSTTQNIYSEHDPDMVAQLNRLGLRVYAARKGQGSINAGILKLHEHNVFYTASSKNLHIEKTKYMWAKDPLTGKSLNTPIDQYNHLMDSIRYGVYTHFYRS